MWKVGATHASPTRLMFGGSSNPVFTNAPTVGTSFIKLDHICGTTIRAHNYENVSVTVTWDAVDSCQIGRSSVGPRFTDNWHA